jgi:pSer/pThr/pTyr-binding forkhead associated (FHA) protein
MIRITAGVGSAGQKTWNIRRPVTLIGSCRPAHIVLHAEEASKCHCVIVNTGTDVLLRDLHTTHGTYCNQKRVDLVVLKDGDVITVGELRIQIAIRTPENQNDDSGCGLRYADPTLFPEPVTLRLDHTDQQWRVEEAVALIGRHRDAHVRVDHPDIASRHAVLFKFANAPAIADLGSRAGIAVNGQRCSMAGLEDGARVAIGPCTLLIGSRDSVAPVSEVLGGSLLREPGDNSGEIVGSKANAPGESGGESVGSTDEGAPSPHRPGPPFVAISDSLRAANTDDVSAQALSKIESELAALQTNLSTSWDDLNSWESRLREDATKLDRQQVNLSAREAELDAQDASLRGQLHDLTRYHEQIVEREKELAAQLAKIQEERDLVSKAESELATREGEVTRRADELRNREHVLAQRWARLQASTCPHCGKAIRAAPAG